MVDVDGLMFHEVFGDLSHTHFQKRYTDEVGELEEVHSAKVHDVDHPEMGQLDLFELTNGYCAVHIQKSKRWYLYETEAHYRNRKHIADWANFARGAWSPNAPTKPGIYFAKSLDGAQSVRHIRKSGDRVVDVSGGLVPPGQVTVWRGSWWYPALPSLPS